MRAKCTSGHHNTDNTEMESMPFSRLTLTLAGIQISSTVSRWTRCRNYFTRTIGVLTMSGLLSIPIYSILFGDTFPVTAAAMLGMFSTKLVSYVTLFSKEQKLFNVLAATLNHMDKTAIRKIKRYDQKNCTINMIFITTVAILTYAYLIVFGFKQEIITLVLGIRSRPDTNLTFLLIPITLFFVFVCFYVLFLQFYASVLLFASQFAILVHEHLVRADRSIYIDYETIRKALQHFNKLMQTINQEAGVLPFSLLAMEFIMFANGISFLVISNGKFDVSPLFAVLSVGSMNVLYITFVCRVICLSSKTHTTISQAWKMAEAYASDPLSINSTGESRRMRKSLKFFLITESAVPAKACNTFVIDASLILSFFAQVVPFTVMLFMTMKEMEQKDSCSKSTN